MHSCNKNIKQLGNRIQYLRKLRGLTQAQLAELVNRSTNHISKIELGGANPSVSLIFELSSALNFSPYELFKFDENNDVDFIISEFSKVTNPKHKKSINTIFKSVVDGFINT